MWASRPALARSFTSRAKAAPRAEELLRWLDLWEHTRELVEGFSRGMRQKLALAGALIVGLIRAAAIMVLPEAEILSIYLVVIAVLILRPAGLFGKAMA